MNVIPYFSTIEDLEPISLDNPVRLQGGAYYSAIQYGKKDFFLQLPECETKAGIIQTGKRTYTDLMFDDNNEEFIQWFMDVETQLKKRLFEKADKWFHNDMDEEDIDYFFHSCLKTYRRHNYLLRAFVGGSRRVPSSNGTLSNARFSVFDEDENVKTYDDVKGTRVISIIHVKGIRFTSTSFHIDTEVKQMMLIREKEEIFQQCLLRRKTTASPAEDVVEDIATRSVTQEPLAEEIAMAESTISTEDVGIEELSNVSENESDVDITVNSIGEDLGKSAPLLMSTEEETTIEASEGSVTLDISDAEVVEEENGEDRENNDEVSEEITIEVTDDVQAPPFPSPLGEAVNQKIQEEVEKRVQEGFSANKNEKVDEKNNENDNDSENHDSILEPVEFTFDTLDTDDAPITLKQPNEVYYEIYREARRKAKLAKKKAILAYLEAKQIKQTYMLEVDGESSDDEDFSLTNNFTDTFDREQQQLE